MNYRIDKTVSGYCVTRLDGTVVHISTSCDGAIAEMNRLEDAVEVAPIEQNVEEDVSRYNAYQDRDLKKLTKLPQYKVSQDEDGEWLVKRGNKVLYSFAEVNKQKAQAVAAHLRYTAVEHFSKNVEGDK